MVKKVVPPAPLTSEDWQKQEEVWEGRVRVRGPQGAIFHVGHGPEAFEALTRTQGAQAFAELDKYGVPDGPAMDYGCGWGRWTPQLAQRYERPAIGVDICPSLLAYATRHIPADSTQYIEYLQLQEGRIPMANGSVGLIWAWTTLSAILDPRMLLKALDEWNRVLTSGGVVCLVDNTSKVGGKPVRSPHSVSRTVEEYQLLFRKWCPLTRVGDFVDLGEVNTIFLGRKR